MQEAKQEIKQYNVRAVNVEKRKSAPLLSEPISALTGCSFWHCPPDKSKPDIWPVWYLPFVCKSSANSGLHLWTVHAYRSSKVFRALSECRFASDLCVFGVDFQKLSVSGKSGYIVNSALALGQIHQCMMDDGGALDQNLQLLSKVKTSVHLISHGTLN